AVGDTTGTALGGGASLAIDWDHDGRMDVVEFARSNVTGPIHLYLNTTGDNGTNGVSFSAPVVLATNQQNIGGAVAVDYDWDGNVDIVYQLASSGNVLSIANTNQVADGTSLHLRILDHEGFNVF